MNKARRRLMMVVGAWDVLWRIVAVRRAILNRDRKWLIPLLTVSSAGILPLFYLYRSGRDAEAGESPTTATQ